jgi:glycosyltransferase involved in cell wall biosynthesis
MRQNILPHIYHHKNLFHKKNKYHQQKNNFYFNPTERFHVRKESTVEELALFISKYRIKIIHIHQCGEDSLNLFRKAANRSDCIIITTCHSKPYSLLLNYTFSYCLRKMRQVSLKGKILLLKRLLMLNSNRKSAADKIQSMYHAIFSSSDRVIISSECFVPEMERILQREISGNEYQVISPCVPYKRYFPEEFVKRIKLNEIAVIGIFDETRLNLKRIIDIWTRIQATPKYIGWVLRIIGKGVSYSEYKKKILTSKNIIFENFSQLESCYNTASIYISAAELVDTIDPFLLGAMQNGLVPVVYNTSEQYSEIIDNECNGFILPVNSNEENFEEKLCCLMDDEELRNKMAKHAIAGSKKYSQQKFKDSYAKLYSQI